MSERILFVDRDGTILEEPHDFQVDSFEKMRFVEGVLPALKALREAGWKLVMVSNQDGLGTASFPAETFKGPHELMMQILESQGAHFDEVLICPHMPGEGCSCRKPNTGLVKQYLKRGVLDKHNSYVIGDRETDLMLAKNMGLTGLRVGPDGQSWAAIEKRLLESLPAAPAQPIRDRHSAVERVTKETQISVEVWLDRSGENDISTGIGFFDHMLDQIAVHGGIRLHLHAKGDLQIDDHHMSKTSDSRSVKRCGWPWATSAASAASASCFRWMKRLHVVHSTFPVVRTSRSRPSSSTAMSEICRPK